MSHFPLFIHLLGIVGEQRECVDFVPRLHPLHVPDWDSSQPHAVEQPLPGDAPPGPALQPGEESTHSERCPPKLASHRAWETGAFPSPRSGAQGLHPRESFHHSLSAIHKQPPPPLPHTHSSQPPPSHTHLPPCPLLHIYIFIFHTPSYIDISHRLWSFFTRAVSYVSCSAERTVCWSDCLSHLSLPA